MWNSYDSVFKHQLWTNDAVEGWHHEFNSRLAANHVTIGKFINRGGGAVARIIETSKEMRFMEIPRR